MAQIPTAAEFLDRDESGVFTKVDIVQAMIEFAKLHIEQAVKAKVNAMYEKGQEDSSYSIDELDAFTRDSYPLTNIK